jgi:hypothetical protein
MPPPSLPLNSNPTAEATACRAVYLRTDDAQGLCRQLGFEPSNETAMQRPKPTILDRDGIDGEEGIQPQPSSG